MTTDLVVVHERGEDHVLRDLEVRRRRSHALLIGAVFVRVGL